MTAVRDPVKLTNLLDEPPTDTKRRRPPKRT